MSRSFSVLILPFRIAFHLQLVLLSYHSIFLRPYHFLKLVSFLGATRTKSASVCPWLWWGAIETLGYNTIQYNLCWFSYRSLPHHFLSMTVLSRRCLL